MKQTISTVKVLALAIVAAGVLGGCASSGAKWDQKLVERTSQTLAISPSEFTISDQQEESNAMMKRTNYVVTTNSGERYSCYLATGRINMGMVGDAVCREAHGGSKNITSKKPNNTISSNAPDTPNKRSEKNQPASKWDQKLIERTSQTLALSPSEFTISNQQDENTALMKRTNYVVTTNSGERYSCYLATGRINMGMVGDAVCREAGGSSKKGKGKNRAATSRTCNELLRAAGSC